LKVQKVRDIVHKTNRFNRKKLHVPPRAIGITADYVQYIRYVQDSAGCADY